MTRVTAVEDTVEAIKADIRAAAYAPGDYLPAERDYAERFGVSRNTVREALLRLDAWGMVERTPRGSRMSAKGIDPVFQIVEHMFERDLETCRDLIAFRKSVELGSLPDTFAKITPENLNNLDAVLERMEAALTGKEAALADYDFHAILIEASGNNVLRKLYRVLRHVIVFYMEIGKAVPHHDKQMLRHHRAMAEALRAGDRAALETAANNHYAHSAEVLHEAIEGATERAAAADTARAGAGGTP